MMNKEEREKYYVQGPYIVWENNGEGWSPNSYETLKEAVLAHKYTSQWVITRPIDFKIGEAYFGEN